MLTILTGEQVFQFALELEETAEVFYEVLAVACRHEQVAALCRRLARDEVQHGRTFGRMRDIHASGQAKRELTPGQLAAAQDLINRRLVPDPAAARELASSGDVAELLEMAVKMEHDSIDFYGELVARAEGRDAEALNTIIQEEVRHKQDLLAARRGL